ncbi:MAG: DNA-binding MarR family transcriptional regulator [Patiriisocius sp.]|jgi:DNA-binding MarR family transcriptional regulator
MSTQTYAEFVGTIQKLNQQMNDVVKDELERLRIIEVNATQAILLYNIGAKEVTAGDLKKRGFYLGSNVSYSITKMINLGYVRKKTARSTSVPCG